MIELEKIDKAKLDWATGNESKPLVVDKPNLKNKVLSKPYKKGEYIEDVCHQCGEISTYDYLGGDTYVCNKCNLAV